MKSNKRKMMSTIDNDNSSQSSNAITRDSIRSKKPYSMFLSQAAFQPNQYDSIWLQLQLEIFEVPLRHEELDLLRLRISIAGAKSFYDTRSLAKASTKKIPNQNAKETNASQ